MRRKWAVFIVVVVTVGGTRAAGDVTPGRDLGAEVRRVFAAKCAGCHGPGLPNPMGRSGYVLDLRRVADNPEMVIPGRPDESELWALVRHGDMPPADSPGGPLSAAEKGTIHGWIATGAPDAVSYPTGLLIPSSSEYRDTSATSRIIRWLGKYHLLLLHFPIALIIAAGFGEGVAVWWGSRTPSPAVQFCLTLAAVVVVPTVALGWLQAAAGNGVVSPGLLTVHRWVGTVAGVWVLGTDLTSWQDTRRGERSLCCRSALVIGILLVIATAHAGGLTTHGRAFFDW
jgi:hypothetical protein